jgi:uncharacterized repeat protein (TIGR03803 family)
MIATPCSIASVCSASALAFVTAALPAQASSVQVIYSFAGGTDGLYADTDVVMDPSGNLYGTTVQGGDHASGTVWQLHPNGDGSWSHSVLYSFTGGADGAEPYKGVTLDASGNLYGTATSGGGGTCDSGCGVAYMLANDGAWTQSVIHAFTGGDDGAGPGAPLTVGPHGDLYGMAPTGGADGAGTIYRIYQKNGAWNLQVIHTFTGGKDGSGGSAGRLVLKGLSLYGTATAGGKFGEGTVYSLAPASTGAWPLHVLYAFKDQPDGGFPYGGLMFDGVGNLYGTTYYAGANDLGMVYELTPMQSGRWREHALYSFRGGSDGAQWIGNLVSDSAGNLYGTTSAGGALGQGTVFALAPKKHHTWQESVLHSFGGSSDGALPYSGMIGDGQGHFFGATTRGGSAGDGALFEFTP